MSIERGFKPYIRSLNISYLFPVYFSINQNWSFSVIYKRLYNPSRSDSNSIKSSGIFGHFLTWSEPWLAVVRDVEKRAEICLWFTTTLKLV